MKEKRLRKHIHINTLVTFLVISFIFVPFLIFGGILLIVNENYAKKSYGNYMVQLLESAKRQMDTNENLLSEGILSMYHNGVVDLMEHDALNEQEKSRIQDEIQAIHSAYSGSVSAVYLKHGDDIYMTGDNYINGSELIMEQEATVMMAGGRRQWQGPYALQPKRKSGYKMVLARAINGADKQAIAQIYLVVDVEKITAAFKNEKLEPMIKFILDGTGSSIYTELQEVNLQHDFENLHFENTSGYQTARLDGKSYFIAHYQSYQNDWLVGVMLLKRETTRELILIRWVMVVLVCIYVVFLLVMIMLMQRSMIAPIRSLTSDMDDFSQGNFAIRATPAAITELDKLNLHFNEMIVRISELIERNRIEEAEKNAFKMKALKSQLDPHFIFNTLNTIKWMAMMNRQDNIQTMIETLVRLLMVYTRDKAGAYTVQDELDLIRDYATIQKARFMNFDIEVDVEADAGKCEIPKFLLQPVVENSIIHGFTSGKGRRGKIRITVVRKEDLFITIEDNGVGFLVDVWQEKEATESVEHTHIALGNLKQIIEIEYGPGYEMAISSEVGIGTRVEYHLPVIVTADKEEESDD